MLKKSLKCLGLIIFAAAPLLADAAVSLKRVQVTDGNRVDLFFDGKVSSSQVRTEFLNDVVQLSIQDASVYPAKINSVSSPALSKVFAYQYAPKLVRCRLTVKGKAESYADRMEVVASGKQLTIHLSKDGVVAARVAPGTAGDQSPAVAKKAPIQVTPAVADSPAEPARVDLTSSAPLPALGRDEKELLDRVTRSQAAPEKIEKPEKSEPLTGPVSPARKSKAAGASPMRAFGSLGIVLLVFAAAAFAFRKFATRKGAKAIRGHKGLAGFLGKFAGAGNQKLIEVIATHHLGPKKSIAIVKIGSRQLVLGVTSEAINLIAEAPAGSDVSDGLDLEELAMESVPQPRPQMGAGAVSAGARPGMNPYQGQAAGVVAPPQAPLASYDPFNSILRNEAQKQSARDRIKSRLEGFKQL